MSGWRRTRAKGALEIADTHPILVSLLEENIEHAHCRFAESIPRTTNVR